MKKNLLGLMRIEMVAICLLLFLCISDGQALIINDEPTETSNPPKYSQPPEDDFGWGYVGRSGGGSAVYLGYGWVLGAHHVGAASLVIQGTTYQRDTTVPVVRLDNPGGGAQADLIMFKLLTHPELPPLQIAASSPEIGTNVAMAGRGYTRASELKRVKSPPQPLDGYDWSTANPLTMTWGTNTISVVGDTFSDVPERFTHVFRTRFDDVVGNAQSTQGDSGGAVFSNDAGNWYLSGIMIAASWYEYDGKKASVFGNESVIADLSVYRQQIVTTIPEPATMLFMLCGVILFTFRRRVILRMRG